MCGWLDVASNRSRAFSIMVTSCNSEVWALRVRAFGFRQHVNDSNAEIFMPPYRAIVLAISIAVAISCDQTPTAPAGAVIGEWGGQGALLIARAASVRVQLSCGFGVAREPLVPDAAGRFVVSIALPYGESTAASTLRGTVDDSAIMFEVITITSDTIQAVHYTVVRDQAPDFGFCFLSSAHR